MYKVLRKQKQSWGDRMNFAFLFYLKDSFGGAERRIARIYNELCAEEKKIKCDVVVRGCNKETALRLFQQADCDITHFNRLLAFKSPLICLLYLIFTRRYKLVHFFDACNYNIAVQFACKLRGKKSIYTVCDYQEAYNILPESQMKRVKKQLHLADYIDLLNPTGEGFISQHIKHGKLSITPGTFTDLDVFVPQKKEKTIVYAAARLEDSKNPRLFIQGINNCKEVIKDNGCSVYLLGKGKDEQYLKDYIKQNELDQIVHMVGYDKTSKYLPTASVFFSLQKLENYPSQSLVEAAACGCYLIITDVGDSRKCADESFASFIKDDPNELSQSLIKYINFTEEQKEKIVRDARKFSEIHYSIEDSKKYFKELLLEAEKEG